MGQASAVYVHAPSLGGKHPDGWREVPWGVTMGDDYGTDAAAARALRAQCRVSCVRARACDGRPARAFEKLVYAERWTTYPVSRDWWTALGTIRECLFVQIIVKDA